MDDHIEFESKRARRQRWKLNFIITIGFINLIVFTMVIGSMGQIYKKLYQVELPCEQQNVENHNTNKEVK